jgi:hypothetical protein
MSLKSGASEESITDVVSHLQNLLLTKEKELKEREADFDRRVKTFESTHPSIGGDNDVIQLNVGGRTNTAVLRSTLTQFEDSMLAAKFSGRWDDSMEKDRDGNIFIDQDPDSFMILITYLRMRMNNQLKEIPNTHRPEPTYQFCSMLEYYNLMPALYPQTWVGVNNTAVGSDPNNFVCEEIAYGTVTLATKEGEYATAIHPYEGISAPEVHEFTVEFDKGTSGAVGWFYTNRNGSSSIGTSFDCSLSHSLILNVTARKVFGPESTLQQNMRINHTDSTTKVNCHRSGKKRNTSSREYSIEVADNERVALSMSASILPVIYFSGSVTISGLKYAINELGCTGTKGHYTETY